MSRLANPNEERENTGGAAASSDDNDNGAPRERRGGLGRDKASRKFENATAEEREAANSDGRFGYYDMVNKRYVPAFFDAIDGGGRDTRGDFFEGGPLSDLLNKIVHPYGTLRERAFVAPNTSSAIQAAVQGGGSSGRASPTVDQRNMDVVDAYNRSQADAGAQAALMSDIYDGTILPAGSGGLRNRVGADYPSMNMPAIAGYTAPFTDQMTQPSALTGGTVQPMPASSQDVGFNAPDASGYEMNKYLFDNRKDIGNYVKDMINPAAFSANPPSAEAMTAPTPAPADRNPQLAAFNQAMSTVPAMLKGTQIEDMYRDHLLNGGGGTFAQFTGAQ